MAAMSRGTVTKSRSGTGSKPKGGTVSSRKHRFESFSQRIAKLKIEPVRRGRNTVLDDAELDDTFSYFRNSLDEWKGLNMAETFTAFARQVSPLCESLPQLLHHADRILDLLVETIEKADTWSQEPLLGLTAHFAHDLGAKFEKYFERVVKTVSHVAATHQAVEVIEWSFSCLAWLFKYLSRLLVPDLRPIFDLMAPLLGKEHQKAFVASFAAESLSFLVRKAGATYHRDKKPLELIIKHISDQLEELQDSDKDHSEFQRGLMSLFADSMKGVQRGLHSSAVAILQEMLRQTYHPDHVVLRVSPLEPILKGSVISMIHHSDAETFEALLVPILEQVKSAVSETRWLGLSSRLLYIVCGVRKGSRVKDWPLVFQTLKSLFDSTNPPQPSVNLHKQDFLAAVAVLFQYCPLDTAIPHVQLLEVLSQDAWENDFLPFCNLFADIGSERFKALLLPYFKRFVAQKAEKHGPEICTILPELRRNEALPSSTINVSPRWQEAIIKRFKDLTKRAQSDDDLIQASHDCTAYLDASATLDLRDDIKEKILNQLQHVLKQAIQISDPANVQPLHILATGTGFQFLVEDSRHTDVLLELWPSLCQASQIYGNYPAFWQSMLALMEKNKTSTAVEGAHRAPFEKALMSCLGSPSHDLRLVALGILELLATKSEDQKTIVATARMIEDTPLSLETARLVSMRIRQLAKTYPTVCSDDWVSEAIPTYCFGLLHVKFSQVWDDTCVALKEMCNTKEGEGHITRISFEWLNEPESTNDEVIEGPPSERPIPRYASEFECTNLMHLERKSRQTAASFSDLELRLKSAFQSRHPHVPFITLFSRAQSLRLLNTIPQVAEKKSRLLVPVLLQWALNHPTEESAEDETTGDETETNGSHWSRKDQKAMLTVFSKFNNPRVLYKAEDVHEALLVLLGNGDVEIQKAALKAIMTWKNPAITRYQENLSNLLDDARFREEISVFMDVSKEDSHLQNEHRADLLPVILRILYGKVVSGKRGQEAKRKAVFIALTRFEQDAVRQFLNIAFGPIGNVSIVVEGELNEDLVSKDLVTLRKQVGLLNMLEDMLNTLKTTMTPFVSSIIDPLLYCLIRSSRQLTSVSAIDGSNTTRDEGLQTSLLKTVRQRGFHVLNILFENCPEHPWDKFIPAIVQELAVPRLQQLPIETAQSVSGLLRLFGAWSKSPKTALFLVQYNQDILVKVIDTLEVPSAKEEVKQFVLDQILRSLISLGTTEKLADSQAEAQDNSVRTDILQKYAPDILSKVGDLLKKSPSKELLESAVHTVADIAPHITGSTESRGLIEIACFLLTQPSKRVNSHTKLGLLRILYEFIPRCSSEDLNELLQGILDVTCSLFAFVKDRAARTVVCDVLKVLSSHTPELDKVSQLCYDLNAFSTTRLDEPDFDRRSSAFNTINQDQGEKFSLMQWKPIVYNMLYHIKDNDELVIRDSASLSLRRFIDASTGKEDFKPFLTSAIIPGLQNGMREDSELVRNEFLAVLSHLISTFSEWPLVADMHVLLGPDDEASFFGNILHIQAHRRLRALRKLAASASELKSGNIAHFFIPLIEHFIFNKAEDESAHNLAGEAIKSISSLSEWLEWPQFRSLLRRFIGYLTSKEDLQKTVIKLLAGMMDALNRAGQAKGYTTAQNSNGNADEGDEEPADENAMDVDVPKSMLTKTLPQQEKLTTDLSSNILPPLTKFLHDKDEATVSLRVPIAIAVVKVLLVLPPQEVENRLPSVLLDICQILKSRSQDARDMSRNTLSEIALLTGPSYLGFILKSLRGALQRGYQLHVLSFTLHHILVKLTDKLKPGDLDYCLPEIVDVIMDDIFGVTGQEKDAEEYISKMREVKSSKSYDSMDIVSRSATPSHLVDLIMPTKSLLCERITAKMVQKIDELLRRVGLGILQNPTVQDRDILIFCYELIQEVYKTNAAPVQVKSDDSKSQRYIINIKGAAKSGARGSTSSHIYKITRFSFDVLRTVLKKHSELQTPQNLAGFLPIIGDALVQGHEEVQISAIRLLTTIIKTPLDGLDKDCPVYVTESVRMIKGAPSSNTELAQASLKLISAILRERPNVEVKERDVAHLLKRIIPDLDEPDRQGVTFGFVKAVMNRKIIITEIYEVMDRVAAMMVTNQTRSARDLARSNYFHFLMEYPQAKNRFTKQLEFLIRNLRYDHVEGRQSVMEAINLILTKVGDNVLQDVLGMMFIPLVHTMANDDSSDCRTMAGALLKKLFERADAQRMKGFVSDLRTWLEQDEDSGLKRLGIQCWGLYFEVAESKPSELEFVLTELQSTVEESLERRDEDDWELLYYSLTVFQKLCKSSPDLTFSSEDFWDAIQTCVSYPHAWVKLTAAKLMGMYFADVATTNKDNGLTVVPLVGSHGLQLTEVDMIKLTNAFLRNLAVFEVTEELCAQSVRNLTFLARCFAVNGLDWNWHKVHEAAGDENNNDEDDEEEEDAAANPNSDNDSSTTTTTRTPPTAIHRLITRLSALIRRETKIMKAQSLYPKTAVLTLLETLTSNLPIPPLLPSLPHLLTTLSILTDPLTPVPRSTDAAFNDAYRALIDKAREVMRTLQKRMGSQEYLAVIGDVQRGIKERREERRQKRKIAAVVEPEKVAREKRRRHEGKKVKRKERGAESRGLRRGW
ncbi:hypothetical protein BU24DRAFT_468919 [Aaosphaeria arxii CBS 175.79]|uniref:Uncharacterized protein n=1 Tax=Aaosphaeria arxii CBS 175.79 TaxID=1450172 RepID=A0A6A5X6G7_9PLEO|nr:uncharacterized protein BU24DRAFT_468919 [Aaosphaeria arxii CBS 175.79]KAF2008500.1 hypothetical protein BU24DRAFT_468919 [Aaosphaeria arxii CBS 175.79]